MAAPPRPVAPHVNPAFFLEMQSGTTSVVRLLFVCVCACMRACGLGVRGWVRECVRGVCVCLCVWCVCIG